MFIPWYSDCVRLTGRWSRISEKASDPHIFVNPDRHSTVTTAPGSYLEAAVKGEEIRLFFDTSNGGFPAPHLYIQADGGAMTEAPVDSYLRLKLGPGEHLIKVLYKGGSEILPRWYQTLMGMISFVGIEAEAEGVLPADDRQIIEFVGDSITEGVLADADYSDTPVYTNGQFNRVYQDDVTATYAYLTAQNLNLRAMFQAYGAVGLTREGNGSVPRAGLIYPYVFDHVPYSGEKPDYVVINHGANDRGTTAEEYIQRYEELIALIRNTNPKAQIVCLGAFCGAFDGDIGKMVSRLNDPMVNFVSTKGWLPLEPLHPLRDGHRIAADNLTPILKQLFRL